jgi:hypothetical protein
VKHDRISERLELAALKVALISFAIIGIMLRGIAKEIRE